MQVVIDIDEDEYQRTMRHYKQFPRDLSRYERRIIDGTPLPKGHGRLIDAEKLLDTFWTYCKQGDFGYHQAEDLIKAAPTIIKADGGDAE